MKFIEVKVKYSGYDWDNCKTLIEEDCRFDGEIGYRNEEYNPFMILSIDEISRVEKGTWNRKTGRCDSILILKHEHLITHIGNLEFHSSHYDSPNYNVDFSHESTDYQDPIKSICASKFICVDMEYNELKKLLLGGND